MSLIVNHEAKVMMKVNGSRSQALGRGGILSLPKIPLTLKE